MNRKNKTCFDRIQGAVSGYQSSVKEALFRFRQADEQAKKEAEQYKDSDARYQAQRTAIVNTARDSIETAKELFCANVKTEIGELRKELSSHIMNRPAPALLDALRTFRDFGLQPTKSDVDALLDMAGGNTLGLRAINSVLEATKSPLRIAFPTVETFEKDLDALEKLSDSNTAWTPLDYHSESCAIYTGQPRPGRAGHTWDSVSLLNARSGFEGTIRGLSDMAERWTTDVIPSVEQVKDAELYRDTAAEQYLADRRATGASAVVEPSKAIAVEHAKTMGKQRADADNRSREILSQYQSQA